MPTPAEKAIRSRSTRKGVLVPLLEEHFRKGPVQIENEADVEFLIMLARRIKTRERKRRDDPAVFSPSALGSCLRHAYLRRHHKELKIPFLRSLRPEPNFYFLNGNFLHLKWQFAMHKMEQRINDPKIFRVHGRRFSTPVLPAIASASPLPPLVRTGCTRRCGSSSGRSSIGRNFQVRSSSKCSR